MIKKSMTKRTLLIISMFALFLFSFSCVAAAGNIAGVVQIKSKIRKLKHGKKKKKDAYGSDDFLKKKKADEGSAGITDEIQQVVVYIVDAGKKYLPPAVHATMKQEHRMFGPHVLPIVAGQEVDFPNYDTIYHDVYSESDTKKFELPDYAMGKSDTLKFNKTGIVELFCGIHTNMNAYILVLQNPFFAMPNSSHIYEIKNVPPGKYILRAWHPRVEPKEKEITVPAEGNVQVDFTL